MKHLSKFALNEDGAVTVEWVVLTAAVIGLAVAAYISIGSGSDALSDNTDTTLNAMVVGSP